VLKGRTHDEVHLSCEFLHDCSRTISEINPIKRKKYKMSRRHEPSQLSIRELYVRNQIWSKALSEQCSQLSQRSNQANIELHQRTPIVFSKGLSSTQTLTKTKSHQSSTGGSRTKDSKRSKNGWRGGVRVQKNRSRRKPQRRYTE
jgi:hypothetical protein